jgi:hypothetical protein
MIQKTVLSAVLAAALLAPGVARAQQTPTLGELALKEQERRKALKVAAGKVVTNHDVPRGTVPAPAAAGSATEAKAAAKPEDTKPEDPAKPAEPARDEAWWKARVAQVREELRRNEMFADALQTRINSLTNDFAARDDPYQRARVAEDRSKAVLEMDRVKADLELNRKKIAEIEDEARRAGVPAGWLR